MTEYLQLSEIDHILHRPTNTVGSVKLTKSEEYVADISSKILISKKEVTFVPAILRIFVEALSNVIDNKWRSTKNKVPMKKIKVDISENGKISVYNDGSHIPIEINKQSGLYNPELIFGNLRTSSNYDDTEERLTSGTFGQGAKCIVIFSSWFSVRCVDPINKIEYLQIWENNMKTIGKPVIKPTTEKTGSTEISWIFDKKYFGFDEYSWDTISVFQRYLIDMAMITGIPVEFNGEMISMSNLMDYSKCYLNEVPEEIVGFKHEGCDVVVLPSDEFQAISFVNGVFTIDGGLHVDSWVEEIFRPIVNKMNKPKKPQVNIKDVKQFFKIFVNLVIPNPEFGGATKAKYTGPPIQVKVPLKVVNTIMKWSVISKIEDLIRGKELTSLKKTESKKGFKKIEGLDPANFAGGSKSLECILILTEGLSAKTFALKGMDVGVYNKKGRDRIGALSLRGKFLNVRNATIDSISKNKEVSSIVNALGLRYNIDYLDDKNFSTLNYGKVISLCDQDVDGYHIQGLLLNFFHTLFPSLLKRSEPFFVSMNTPIIRIESSGEKLKFYDLSKARKYILDNNVDKKKIKYYKGLGSSNTEDIEDSFGKKMIEFEYDSKTDEAMNKIFHTKFSNERKKWIEEYDPGMIVNDDEETSSMTIPEFLDTQMIQFSIDDCGRSIPNLFDGFKEGQRKVFYSAILKNLSNDKKSLKVAQFAGYISEKTNYHHGEDCLIDTITGMAQDFAGSNNIPLFYRDGQFGSRTFNGKDAASGRYIFTKFDELTRLIFRPEDDDILNYQLDDGDTIEPEFYLPIIPMILCNGCLGIGTGWSSNIPAFNPKELIEDVRRWINKTSLDRIELKPWYRNFKGEIVKESENKYLCYGRFAKKGDKVIIDEIPIKVSIDDYKDFIETLLEEKKIKSRKNYSKANSPHFEIVELKDGMICNNETLNLRCSISTTNMVLFAEGKTLKKFDSVEEIIDTFCDKRYEYYTLRKSYLLKILNEKLIVSMNKKRFLEEVMNDVLILRHREEDEIVNEMIETGYYLKDGSFSYLLSMQIRSFTRNKVEELESQISKLKDKIKETDDISESKMWLNELDELEKKYLKWL